MPVTIGITGHQSREGIDWTWTAEEIRSHLMPLGTDFSGLSSLAAGSDQLFASCVLDQAGQLVAVIPMTDYEKTFTEAATRASYDRLLKAATRIDLPATADHEAAFLKAGQWIVDHADTMIAIWDGEEAEGEGGTADIVAYARSAGKPIVHINPIERSVRVISDDPPAAT